MTVAIGITGLKQASRDIGTSLARIEKQVPFAASVALTNTAKQVRDGLKDEMRKSFDSPTPYTLGSVYVKPARKTDLVARVGLKDQSARGAPAAKYLSPQIRGGQRERKGVETLLQRRGILPAGMSVVPGKGVKLNRYGNIPLATIKRIVAGLRSRGGGRAPYFAATIHGTAAI